MFTSIIALAFFASAASAAPVESRSRHWSYDNTTMESWTTYRTRYSELGCKGQRGTQFSKDCCQPLLLNQTTSDLPTYCNATIVAKVCDTSSSVTVTIVETATSSSYASPSLNVAAAIAQVSASTTSYPASVSASTTSYPAAASSSAAIEEEELEWCDDEESTSTSSASSTSTAATSAYTPAVAAAYTPVSSAAAYSAPVYSSAAAEYSAPAYSSAAAASYAAPSSSAEASTSAPAVAAAFAVSHAASSSSTAAPVTSTTTTSVQAAATSASAPSGDVKTGGYATYFYQNGNPGACGQYHSDSEFGIAIDTSGYWQNTGSASPYCGKYINIKNTKNGKTVTAQVWDACPTCNNGNSLDLSYGAFTAIAAESDGMVPITWSWA